MSHGTFQTPMPENEPVRAYVPGAAETLSLKAELERQFSEVVDVPLVIGGQEIRTGKTEPIVCPHDHGHVLGHYHMAGEAEVAQAIEAASAARATWGELAWQERAAVFLRCADLLEGPWRDKINAATMLNQSKTVHQAEIDAACELIDFFRFNAAYAEQLYGEQPDSMPGMWNRLEHRPLDGFVFCITPFNFSSIAANLCAAPALMGNTTVWKPSPTCVLSNYYLLKMMEEAGLPAGVINFIPGDGPAIGDQVIADKRLAGIHFTGSTATFQTIWKNVANNIENYAAYPRLVGETGGKDFIFAHPDCGVRALAIAILRGSFEYQGQKCSAASRAYIPASIWPEVEGILREELAQIKMGDVRDFSNYMSAVIDARAFAKHRAAIAAAQASPDAEVVLGGGTDDSQGWFVEPTLIVAKKPDYDTMTRELFGPIMTVYVYPDAEYDQAVKSCAEDSEYALTGAIFARDRMQIADLSERLRFSAGNFYINDKPTGAVVGQQPFGGSRASGTNDKAGSILNLIRWVSPRTIKETFVPATEWRYPFLG